jgi:plasmid stabilization system protein ParE
MSREVFWAPEALHDLADQLSYIAADSETAARLARDRIHAAVRFLAERPVGRPGRVAGTYEKTVIKTSYIVAYELPNERRLHVLRVIHSARDWRPGTWPED